MKDDVIPFNRPPLVGTELQNIKACFDNWHTSGDGAFTKRAAAILKQITGAPEVLLTTSCTDALEMTSILLDIEPGDEVIVPSFTFVSTINAYVLRGAKPVFIDVRPDTLNFDEAQLEATITEKTKAIVPVHYAGVACEMDTILDVAQRHDVPVIEDNAHGLFGSYKGRPLGSLGVMATQSFHETKNISCGEGGALLINDSRYKQRAEIIREKGTNRSRFFRGEVDKYTWVDVGSSFLISDILAAALTAQLEAADAIQAKRKAVWHRYRDELNDWGDSVGVQFPTIPDECEQAYHMFYMLLPSAEAQDGFIKHMRANGVQTVFHYLPLHLSDMGRQFGGSEGDCPVTEDVTQRLVRLPFYFDLSDDAQTKVIAASQKFEA